jgi:hypothetical protein
MLPVNMFPGYVFILGLVSESEPYEKAKFGLINQVIGRSEHDDY